MRKLLFCDFVSLLPRAQTKAGMKWNNFFPLEELRMTNLGAMLIYGMELLSLVIGTMESPFTGMCFFAKLVEKKSPNSLVTCVHPSGMD